MRQIAVKAIGALVAASMSCCGAAQAQPASARTPPLASAWTANDYGRPEAWLCRPGREDGCTADLDAMRVDASGARTPAPFKAAIDPPIDCFYVYPTVSKEPSTYADMTASPEVMHVAHGQAGRLASRCRLFAPIYRQLTGAGLNQMMGGTMDWGRPYADVRDAWRQYLAHDNHGRGVVLVGHSQGTILLQQLIAEEIDGRPAQKRLVAAFLAGDPGLPVPAGRVVGGVFKHVPLCRSKGEVGCVYVWSSYAADSPSANRFFGRDSADGQAGCVNPSAPGGGSHALDAFLPRPHAAPESDPPYVEAVGQLEGQCVRDAHGDVLQVSVLPGRYADLLKLVIARPGASPWGLHPLDVALAQGDILMDIDAETRSWTAAGR